MTPTPQEIAARLSEAQKRALQGAKALYRGETLVHSSSRMATRKSLIDLGLLEPSAVFPGTNRLTPLGLQVRTILETSNA